MILGAAFLIILYLIFRYIIAWITYYNNLDPRLGESTWRFTYDYPVVGVNWKQANAFAHWRTMMMNSFLRKIKQPTLPDFRLPTESEWEYAAVAGYNTTVNLDGAQHGKFYPWRSFDADYHQANGSKSGRNSLRQPYDGNRFNIQRQQYGKLRGDNKQNAFINSITDGALVEGNSTFGSRSHIEYDNYMMTPTYRDISFEEMRTGQFLANFRHGRELNEAY